MEYLKVFTDFVEVIETLGEAERGRLFTAMLKYAGQGIEPDFRGNERFVWPIAKQNIDRTVVEHEKHIAAKREAGLKGAAKRWQTMANDGSVISANSKNGENGYLKDKDKDKDNIIPPNNPPKGKRFTPPTVEEVRAYCLERKNGIDPQAFIDHYASANWMRGKTKISDWKACVRTWENRRKGESTRKTSKAEELDDFYAMAREWVNG